MVKSENAVETAVRKLDAGVNKVIDRWERRRKEGVVDLPKLRQRAKRLVANIRHLFLSLRQNQHSLSLGIQCLDKMMGNNNNMDVRSAFAMLLRLHDGYILTVSGECRHEGDRDAARNSPFPSKLHDNEAVYSKNNVYSGTAWDEWNDDKCGLRTRLCRLVRVDYDALVEPGQAAAGFEDMVSDTEHTLIEMQNDFKRLKAKMEQVFSAKIIWRDRMEKLSADRVQLERVGSQFQVSRALGVSTMEDWEVLMKPKRKKRIIADDGEADDLPTICLKPCIPSTAPREDHGLQVKVAMSKPKDAALPAEVSLNEIKQTMGVNVQQLEAARMEVEGEEEAARKEAEEIDDAEPEIYPDEAKRRVKRARKAYERALLSNDDTAIWNTRELLREEMMRAGDVMLDTDDQALSYFENAAALVRSQQQLDQKLGNDIYFGLNLRMLLCRAEINIVIACIQIATRRPPRREQCLQRACQEAESAVAHAKEMKEASDDVADQLRAVQLYSLAMRNKGVALWHLRKREEAIEAFNAAGMSPQISAIEEDPIVLECHIERYNAWTILADLSISMLEQADMKAIQEDATFYSNMFQTVTMAMIGARNASTDIQKFSEERGTLDVTSPDELMQSLSELESWWNERKNEFAMTIDSRKHKNTTRGDVSLPISKAPSRRFIIGGTVSSTRQPASKQMSFNKQRHCNSKYSQPPPRQQASPAIRTYRKWREDMIMDSSTGKWVPKLEYPAVAPLMPPEIAALLAARRSQKYQ